VGAGQRERAERAALYSAEAAGQRHQGPAELAGRAGQHQPVPRDRRSGHLERGGQQRGLTEHAQAASRQDARATPRTDPVASHAGQSGSQPRPPRPARVACQPLGPARGGKQRGGARGHRRGGRKQPPAADAGGRRPGHQHGQDHDHGGEAAGQHGPYPGGAVGAAAAVLSGLPGGRGGRACRQQRGQPGGGEYHCGYGAGWQPGPGRSQQLALCHHQAG
jgi:hypothetical protein